MGTRCLDRRMRHFLASSKAFPGYFAYFQRFLMGFQSKIFTNKTGFCSSFGFLEAV